MKSELVQKRIEQMVMNFEMVPSEPEVQYLLNLKDLAYQAFVCTSELISKAYQKNLDDVTQPIMISDRSRCLLLLITLMNNHFHISTFDQLAKMEHPSVRLDNIKILAKMCHYASNIFTVINFYDNEDSTNLLTHDINQLLFFLVQFFRQSIDDNEFETPSTSGNTPQ